MKTLIVLNTLTLVVSCATLAIVIIGGRKVKAEVETVKVKTNDKLKKFKSALLALED